MSERGIIITDPIYNTELREAVFEYVKDWPKGSAIVCLSVVGAPGGLYPGEEKEEAEDLAAFISELMTKMPEASLPDTIKVHCIPDSAEPTVYIASRSRNCKL